VSVATTRDAFLGGRLTLHQPRRGHRAGTDAALLAACVSPPTGARVVDMGSGVGAAGIAIAIRAPGCRVVLVDNDAAIAALARLNIEENGVADRVVMIEADVTAKGSVRPPALSPGHADFVVTNPPFHLAGTVRPSPDDYRRQAHQSSSEQDQAWIAAACGLLRPKGILAMIHRADALPRLLRSLAGRFGDIRVKPVQARSDQPASRILLRAVRGSRAPFVLLPALALHGGTGSFTEEAEAVHRGDLAVDWRDTG
jgi:tRNA1(Val) A37 N6-methylase TrmN6